MTFARRLLLGAALVLCQGAAFALPPEGFKVQADEKGVWWFVAPDGSKFISVGVNNVSPRAWNPREGTTFYDGPSHFGGDEKAWGASTAKLLKDHGFNTLGAWSSGAVPDAGLYRTVVLYVAGFGADRTLEGFRPGFEETARKNIAEQMQNAPDRSRLLGVFFDNEAPWFGRNAWDRTPTYTVLDVAFSLPAGDAARQAAVKFLTERYRTPAKMGEAWGAALKSWNDLSVEWSAACLTDAAKKDRADFTTLAAERFFERAAKVVRQELPGVLILGARFAGDAPDGVFKAVAKHSDVISINSYRFEPSVDEGLLARSWSFANKPVMFTEFSWRARDNTSGNPNTRGAGPVVQTQAQRGEGYAGYVSDAFSHRMVVGTHWFEYFDQSPQGRFDGEDSNYGLVDIKNRPYADLLSRMRATNGTLTKQHASTARAEPKASEGTGKAKYTPGQHPDRAPTVDLLGEWIQPPEIWGAPDAKVVWSRRGRELVLAYDTGAQYGGGVNLFGPATTRVKSAPAPTSDLDGYAAFVIEFTAPKGVQLNVVLAEAAAGPPGQVKYDIGAGDDGEAFISEPFAGTGSRTTARIELSALERQKFFGSQSGKNAVDTRAVRNFGLQIQGRPQTGEVAIHRWTLER
ncbi:MAG: hypothetical protein SFY95_08120 [Planctomycetota bacterium]|nr:hypothetical protein [Planctomycetota bacterium]